MNAYEYYRRMAGLSQAEAAKKIGVNQSAVSMWERGENKPRATTMIRVAAAYNVSPENLLINPDAAPARN